MRFTVIVVQFTIRHFIDSKASGDSRTQVSEKTEAPVRIVCLQA